MKSKKQLQQEEERLDAMAEPGKKGVANTKAILDKEQEEEKQRHVDDLNRLDMAHGPITYNGALAKLLLRRLHENEWPKGWSYLVAPTSQGIVMEVQSPDNRTFRRAFRPVTNPLYDVNAVENFAVSAQNTVDKITYGTTPAN